MYQNFIIPYLYEAQHVSGDTGSLWFFIRGRLFERVVGGRYQAHCA